MAKNRIRDNASLSAPNDAGADHDWRGSRVRRLAKELTILTATRRAGSRLCTSRRESVFCEAHAGRGSRAARAVRLARMPTRLRGLGLSFDT